MDPPRSAPAPAELPTARGGSAAARPARHGAHARGWVDRICDSVVIAFALWTLLTHAAVYLGAGLDQLIVGGATATVAATLLRIFRSRRSRTTVVAPHASCQVPGTTVDSGHASSSPAHLSPYWSLAILTAAAVGTLLPGFGLSLITYWICALVVSGGVLVGQLSTVTSIRRGRVTVGNQALLAALAVACAVTVATAHRPDADDAFYLNLVVSAVDHPGAPLLAHDTLHGYSNIQMTLPVFKVLSYEMLQAAASRLSGIPAITVVHILMPPLVALLIPLAYARLLGILLPGRWPWCVGLVVAQLLLVGDGDAGYGDFAILRLHQGKSILLHVALPLLSSYGLEFASAPSRARWLRLAAAQIAVVGLSSSGLWLAPVIAGLALAAGLPLRWKTGIGHSVKTLALGLCASFHPLLLAAVLRPQTGRAFREALHPIESLSWSGDHLMEHAIGVVLGSGISAELALFAMVAAFAAATPAIFRRFAAVSLICFLLLLWNPLMAPFIAANVTGPDTYFRVFWAVPLPVMLAAVLSAPLELRIGPLAMPRWAAIAATLVLASGLLGLAPEMWTLSRANRVHVGPPSWKVPAVQLEAAREIVHYSRPGEFVLAPSRIARWIPLIHDHPSPLVVREMYLDVLHDLLGAAELDRRTRLLHLVGGDLRLDAGGRMLAEAIEQYPLSVVCLGGPAMAWPELRRALIDSPLEVRSRNADLEVWARRHRSDAAH